MGGYYMDIKKIKKLIDLLEKSQLSGLEIKEGDIAIKLTRELHSPALSIPHERESLAVSYPYNKTDHQTSPTIELTPTLDTNHYVLSPMVGTFYRSTTPDKAPLVAIGDHVKIGDTLSIIEAMKIMNFIQADKTGIIKDILVNNAEAVEFEQPLFIIE